jgi:hypothetical protein
MAQRIAVKTAFASEIDPDCFVVIAVLKSGGRVYHDSGKYAFYTDAEAQRLAASVRARGSIDAQHWASTSRSYAEIEEEWTEFAYQERDAA